MSRIRTAWAFFIDNLDALVAIVIGILAAVVGVIGGSQWETVLLSAIAAVLAVLAFGMIKDRAARKELSETIHKMEQSRLNQAGLKSPREYIPFPELVASASDICLEGASLITIFTQFCDYLVETKINQHKANLRVVILDPGSNAVAIASDCLQRPVDTIKKEIDNTIAHIQLMQSRIHPGKGSLELRLMDTYPNMNLVMIDADKPGGMLFVDLVGYHAPPHERPHLELKPDCDQRWYAHFKNQFEALWGASRPVPSI
jgi:hypothetical protein